MKTITPKPPLLLLAFAIVLVAGALMYHIHGVDADDHTRKRRDLDGRRYCGCGEDEYADDNCDCHPCTMCPAGSVQEAKEACGRGMGGPTNCVPCNGTINYSPGGKQLYCIPCTDCMARNRFNGTACTIREDAECGSCYLGMEDEDGDGFCFSPMDMILPNGFPGYSELLTTTPAPITPAPLMPQGDALSRKSQILLGCGASGLLLTLFVLVGLVIWKRRTIKLVFKRRCPCNTEGSSDDEKGEAVEMEPLNGTDPAGAPGPRAATGRGPRNSAGHTPEEQALMTSDPLPETDVTHPRGPGPETDVAQPRGPVPGPGGIQPSGPMPVTRVTQPGGPIRYPNYAVEGRQGAEPPISGAFGNPGEEFEMRDSLESHRLDSDPAHMDPSLIRQDPQGMPGINLPLNPNAQERPALVPGAQDRPQPGRVPQNTRSRSQDRPGPGHAPQNTRSSAQDRPGPGHAPQNARSSAQDRPHPGRVPQNTKSRSQDRPGPGHAPQSTRSSEQDRPGPGHAPQSTRSSEQDRPGPGHAPQSTRSSAQDRQQPGHVPQNTRSSAQDRPQPGPVPQNTRSNAQDRPGPERRGQDHSLQLNIDINIEANSAAARLQPSVAPGSQPAAPSIHLQPAPHLDPGNVVPQPAAAAAPIIPAQPPGGATGDDDGDDEGLFQPIEETNYNAIQESSQS